MCRRGDISSRPRGRASSPRILRRSRSEPARLPGYCVDIKLVFVLPEIEVRAETPSPTDSVQPVSMSDMLAGSVFEAVPLEGDDFQSLLLLLPGVVRGPDGRLRVKGGQPSQGALQMSSASLNDPSTGDFDLEVPSQSVESVEVLANPFAAEYGRFSTSITQIRTRQGTNEWKITPGNLLPRFRRAFAGIKAFEPRFSARGPIKRDRTFLAQDFQLRYVNTPVKSLLDEPEIELRSFDSFTRVDTVVSARHTISGALIAFPRKINHITMNTFRPPETSPDFNQSGWSTGIVDRLALARDVVLETTVSARWFEVNVNTEGRLPMVYAPQTQSGSFFNDQERSVHSLQWVEALSWAGDWHGSHVLKIGTDLQRSAFNGFSESRPLEVRRLDGSLAELTMFGPRAQQDVSGIEFAGFVQDRWRLNSRLSFELGFRVDRDAIVEHFNFSPRAGVAIGVAPEGRAILRGGYGKFVQRTPLNVEAFPFFESRTVTRFATNGTPLGPPVTFINTMFRSAHARCKCRQHRVGPTVWPSPALQAGIPATLGLRRVHRSPGSCCRGTPSDQQRGLVIPGTRGDDAIHGWGAARSHRLVCLGAWDGRPQQLRSILREPPEPNHSLEREQSDSDRRPSSAARSGHVRNHGKVGFRAGAGNPVGVPMVGRERISGLRRRAQPRRAPAPRPHA